MKKLLLLSILFMSMNIHADSSKVRISDGWIKQLPPVVPMRAGYMDIKNSGTDSAEIIAIQSDAFEMVEMHETMMADGMMKMVQQHSIVIPAKGQVTLKPGGKHLMMMSPKTPLKIGDKVNLIITFADEKSQSVQLKVKK